MSEKRKPNPLTIGKGGEIARERVENLIKAVTDRYESVNPKPDARPQDRAFLAWYRGKLQAIGETISAQHIGDIDILDSLFKRVYVPFSVQNGVLPKVLDFTIFMGIDYYSFSTVIENSPNSYIANVYRGWKKICGEYVIQYLSDEPGSNVNLIFVAKSTFGIRDDIKPITASQKKVVKKDRQEIIAELGIMEKDTEQSPE